MHTLLTIVSPHAVTMFILMLVCLFGYGYPGYQNRETGGFFWILWFLGGVMALVAWIILVFS